MELGELIAEARQAGYHVDGPAWLAGYKDARNGKDAQPDSYKWMVRKNKMQYRDGYKAGAGIETK